MYTKSKIQQYRECLDKKSELKEILDDLMNDYNIDDNIFIIGPSGELKEVTMGYFAKRDEYDDLDEAVNAMDIRYDGVRVIDNEKYQVGRIYKSLFECKGCNHQIYDIKRSSDVKY